TGATGAVDLASNIGGDGGVEPGAIVPPFYDPMIAKLVAHAPTRDRALDQLTRALDATVIAGVRTNVPFLANLCRAAAFRQGKIDTAFVDRNLAALGAAPREADWGAAARGATHLLEATSGVPEEVSAGVEDLPDEHSPWAARDGFQLGGRREVSLPIVVDGEDVEAVVGYGADGLRLRVRGAEPAPDARLFRSGAQAYVLRGGRHTPVPPQDFAAGAAPARGGGGASAGPTSRGGA